MLFSRAATCWRAMPNIFRASVTADCASADASGSCSRAATYQEKDGSAGEVRFLYDLSKVFINGSIFLRKIYNFISFFCKDPVEPFHFAQSAA